MIGGTLPPLQALVNHVLSTSKSTHPALALALQDTTRLEVASNTIFKELPLDFSNTWISLVTDFRPSRFADNDFMILNIDGPDDDGGQASKDYKPWRWLFVATGCFTGAVIMLELVFSIFLGDMWAVTLFSIYLFHWTASTLISLTTLIEPRKESTNKIRPDSKTCFAVHQRKTGGTVIFKGRKDSFEHWARQTWQFNKTKSNSFLHWFWILTGSTAAVGSTAAMVNMIATLQLGFLGLLVFCSLAELLLTRVSRELELRPYLHSIDFLDGNSFRTEAIVRAALEPRESCRLDEIDWIELGRLPDNKVFREMQRMLGRISELRPHPSQVDIDAAIADFKKAASGSDAALTDRIAVEVKNSAYRTFRVGASSVSKIVRQATAGVKEAILS